MSEPLGALEKVLTSEPLNKSGRVLSESALPNIDRENRAGTNPVLIASGLEAVAIVAKLFSSGDSETAMTESLGKSVWKQGTIVEGPYSPRMVVSIGYPRVWYVEDDRLYEWSLPFLARDTNFIAFARGVTQAKLFIQLAKVEIALLSGLFVGICQLIVVSVVGLSLKYYAHREVFNSAVQKSPKAIRNLIELRRKYPVLFSSLIRAAAKDILTHLPEGVSGEDVAFFIGRVVKGVDGLPTVTIGTVIRVATQTAAIVSAAHLPAITAEAAKKAAEERAEELAARLASAGIHLSKEEAEKILHEQLSQKESLQTLRELSETMGELLPLLEEIGKLLRD